jgi:5-methylcytosine-specific restriction endonuclease McrA
MPAALARACASYGCQSTVPCAQHSAPKRIVPRHHRVYGTARWRRVRSYVLDQRPACQACLRNGRISIAVDVHHKVAVRAGIDPYDASNLEPLCKSCHSRETAAGR